MNGTLVQVAEPQMESAKETTPWRAFEEVYSGRIKALPEQRRIQVALLGLFGVANYGNEASLEAMLGHLRNAYPTRSLTVICPCPERVANDHQIVTFPMSAPDQPRSERVLEKIIKRLLILPREIASWIRTIGYLRHVEQLVIPGTGFLDDFGVSPFRAPLDIFRWCVCARLSGTRVLFVSIGAGPIKNRLSRWFMKTAARTADYRSYRDHISLTFMTSIGVDTSNDPVYPDLAFSLPVPKSRGTASLPGKPCIVGVGVMAYYGWRGNPEHGAAIFRAYIGSITEFVLWLISQGHGVRLIVGDRGDSPAADHVISEVTAQSAALDDGQFVARPIQSLNDVLGELADTDVVVATRFHNVVCALMLDKPVISIGYAAKNDVLLAEMGLSKYCQHIDRVDLATLISHFCEIRDNRKHFESDIRKRRNDYRRQLAEQFETLFPVPTH